MRKLFASLESSKFLGGPHVRVVAGRWRPLGFRLGHFGRFRLNRLEIFLYNVEQLQSLRYGRISTSRVSAPKSTCSAPASRLAPSTKSAQIISRA